MSRVVIADTSCLIAFSHLNLWWILQQLFGIVLVTQTIADEFGQDLPSWIIIENPHDEILHQRLKRLLDAGEASALTLALEHPGSLLVIDEKKGRRVAQQQGVAIAGTIRLLLEARQRGWLPSLRDCFAELKQTSFRFSLKIEAEALNLAGEL